MNRLLLSGLCLAFLLCLARAEEAAPQPEKKPAEGAARNPNEAKKGETPPAEPAPLVLEGVFKKVQDKPALVAGEKTYFVVAGEKADDATKALLKSYESKLVDKGTWKVTGAAKTDADGKLWLAASTLMSATPETVNVTVTADKNKNEFVNPYAEKKMNTLTRTDTPLNQTPRSIQILTDQEIKAVHAKDLRELYRYMVGVSTEAFMGQYFSRGFRTDHTVFVDGMKNGYAMEHYNPRLNNVERVENHRGPSGIIYGPQENPGGLINVVTKRPEAKFDGGVEVEIGDFNTHSAIVDVTGKIDKKGRFLGRFDGSIEESDTFRDKKYVKTMYFVPAFAYVIGPDTRLDLQVSRYDDHKEGYRDRGLPFINHRLVLPIENAYQEKNDFIDSAETTVLAIFSHKFNEDLFMEAKARYAKNDQRIQYHDHNSVLANGRTMTRFYRRFDKENETASGTVNVTKIFRMDHWKNALTLGLDYSTTENVNHFRQANGAQIPSIDLYRPVYGLGNSNNYVFNNRNTFTTTNRDLGGLFFQDQMTIVEKLHLMGSIRYELYDDRLNDFNWLTRVRTQREFEDDVFTYRLGALYQIVDFLGVFTSYDHAYEPQNPTNQTPDKGGPFLPESSRQVEAGIKTDFLKKRINFNATWYHIIKKNVLQTDPADNTRLVQIGEIRSKGIELELQGKIRKDLWLIANFSHNDTAITKDTNNLRIGATPTPQPPQITASMWLNYHPAKGWNAGVGGNYVDERYVGGGDLDRLPSYIRMDASAGYDFEKFKLKIHCENLLDKEYYTGGYGGATGGLPGGPRTLSLSVGYRF